MNFNAQLSVRLSPSHLATLTLFSPFPILLVLIFAFSLCMLSLMYLSFLSLSVTLFSCLCPFTKLTWHHPHAHSFTRGGMIDVGENSGMRCVRTCVGRLFINDEQNAVISTITPVSHQNT